MQKLVLNAPLGNGHVQELGKRFPDLTIADCTCDGASLQTEIADADIVFGVVGEESFACAKRLRLIQVGAQGVDRLMYPSLVESSVIVANGSGIWSAAVAEHALALTLALLRNFPILTRYQVEHRWCPRGLVFRTLSNSTIAILGTGDIGRHTAQLFKPFNCTVLGYSAGGEQVKPFDRVYMGNMLANLMSSADVVIGALPLTPSTRRMIGPVQFHAMKASALFINVGRGKVVDEEALIAALQQRLFAGAGLDVFENEPLPEDSPLWDFENVIITSHKGGLDEENEDRVFQLLVDNLARLFDGRPLMNVIDKQRGY